MKIALAVWNERISPVFDVSRQILVLEVRNGIITGNREELFANDDPLYRVCRLAELNVEILICGAISQMLAGMLTAYKIRTIPFIAGDVEEVVAAYLTNRLPNSLLSMPGCCRQHNQNYRDGSQRIVISEKFGKREASKTQKENNMPNGNQKGPCSSGTQRPSQGRGCRKQGGSGQGRGQGCGQGQGQGKGQGKGQGQGQGKAGPCQKQDTGQPPDNKNS